MTFALAQKIFGGSVYRRYATNQVGLQYVLFFGEVTRGQPCCIH